MHVRDMNAKGDVVYKQLAQETQDENEFSIARQCARSSKSNYRFSWNTNARFCELV